MLVTGNAKTTVLKGTTFVDTLLGYGVTQNAGGSVTEDSSKAANESMFGNTGNDMLYGGAGNDSLYGEVGDDKLYGGTGLDKLFGGSGNDTLNGGAGNDLLDGEVGFDTAVFGSSVDSASLSWVNGKLTVTTTEGIDTLVSIENLQFVDRTLNANGVVARDDSAAGAENLLNVAASTLLSDDFSLKAAAPLSIQADAFGVVGQTTEGVKVYLGGDGSLHFAPGENGYDYLGQGQTLTTHFTYTVSNGTGLTDSAEVALTITGTGDPASISGVLSGAIAEDDAANVSGNADNTDVDNTIDTFQIVAAGTASANGYGTYSVDAAGNWVYTLDNTNATIDALNDGDTLADTLLLTSQDGTTQNVDITISGNNDAATFSAVLNGTIAEDDAATVSGNADNTDADNTNDVFQLAVAGAASANGYGTYSVDATGNWVFTLDNANAIVDALNNGDTLSDTILLTSEDGTTQNVDITINGSTDIVVLGDYTVSSAGSYTSAASSLSAYNYITGLTVGASYTVHVDRLEADLDPGIYVYTGHLTDTDITNLGVTDLYTQSYLIPGYIGWADDEVAANIPGPFGDPQLTFTATGTEITVITTNVASGPNDGGDGQFDFSLLFF